MNSLHFFERICGDTIYGNSNGQQCSGACNIYLRLTQVLNLGALSPRSSLHLPPLHHECPHLMNELHILNCYLSRESFHVRDRTPLSCIITVSPCCAWLTATKTFGLSSERLKKKRGVDASTEFPPHPFCSKLCRGRLRPLSPAYL